MVASSLMLKFPWWRVAFFAGSIGLMSAALSGLSVGLGALFPNFKEDNPSKIVSSFGGTLCLVISFVYNTVFAAPVTAWLYDWKNRGYPTHGLGGFFTVAYYRDTVVPTLFATWGVWIPVVCILYSLPSLLQVPLFALALSLWVMLYTWMSERR